jgi:fatty acid desaturase
LYCVFFVDLLILITPLVYFGHCIFCSSSNYWFWLHLWYLLAIVLSVLRRFTLAKRYQMVIRINKSIKNRKYNGQKIPKVQAESVNPRRTDNTMAKIAPLISFGHCMVCSSSIYWFWLPLWYLLAIALSVLRRFTYSDCPFDIFWNRERTDNAMAKRYQKGNQNK